jgi:outer membrane protein assembly factor BamB
MKSIVGFFNAVDSSRVLCQHYYDGYVYEGTSPEGIVYRTKDGFSHEEFYTIEDRQVTAIADFGGALFFGTSPNGRVYVYNFNTGNKFLSVVTGDYQVSSFAEFDGKLYAGTSPAGVVYSFDGVSWEQEYDSFGGGIRSMTVFENELYLFLDQAENVPKLSSSGNWSFMSDDGGVFSITGKKKVSTSLGVLDKNENFDHSFYDSVVFNGALYFSGGKKAVLYRFDGSDVEVASQFDGSVIKNIEVVGNKMFVSVDGILYKHESEQ